MEEYYRNSHGVSERESREGVHKILEMWVGDWRQAFEGKPGWGWAQGVTWVGVHGAGRSTRSTDDRRCQF